MPVEVWYIIMVLSWSITYIEAVRIGVKQKTYAFPFWCIALNLTWETGTVYYSFREFGVIRDTISSSIWLVLDFLIFLTYLKWGFKNWPVNVKAKFFFPYILCALGIAGGYQLGMIKIFGFVDGSNYAAFLQNLLMSMLFIYLLISRNGPQGQSMVLAIAKCIGTFMPTLLMGIIGIPQGHPNILIFFIGMSCLVLDMVYILALYNAQRNGGSKIPVIKWFDLLNRNQQLKERKDL